MKYYNALAKLLIKFEQKIYFFVLVFVLTILSLYIWKEGTNLFSTHNDFSYHLAVAQGFIRAKGIVGWDFWESLPIGRAHNYPPLIHVTLASFLKIGFSITTSAKLIIEFVIIGGLTLFSWGLNKLYNIKYALIATVLLATSINFISISATTLPATFAVFATPVILYFTLQKKWIPLWAILTIIFYTHLFVPYFILLALLIYLIIFNQKLIWPTAKIVLMALIAFLPWLIHVLYSGITYIKYFDSNYSTGDTLNGMVHGNIIIILLFIISIGYSIKNSRNLSLQPTLFFVILSLLFLPFIIFSPNRITNGHFIAIASVSAASLISIFGNSRIRTIVIFMLILFCIWTTPYLTFTYKNIKHIKLYFRPAILNRLFKTNSSAYSLETKYSILFRDIKNNSSPGDTITSALKEFEYTNINPKYQIHVANFFASNTSRSTLNLRQPEIFHRSQPDLFSSKLVLLDIPPEAFKESYCGNVNPPGYNIKCNNWTKIKLIGSYMTDNGNDIYLYRNNSKNIIAEKVPRYKFPLWLSELIIIFLSGLVIIGLISKTRPNKQT